MVHAISKESLKENFVSLGVTVSDAVLEKCAELCEAHGVGEEELVETWMAYSLSKLSGADPTLDYLRQMARSCFKAEALPTPRHQPVATSSPLIIYNTAASTPTVDDDILSAYNTTPKAKGKVAASVARTPDNAGVCTSSRSPRTVFSPASFSPSVGNVSAKYQQRTNAGDVVCSFGDTQGQTWKPDGSRLHPTIKPHGSAPPVPPDACYMFQQMRDGAAVLDHLVDWLGSQLFMKHSLGQPARLDAPSPERVWVVGRVCCDGSGRLNQHSVLLEGSRTHSSGVATPCDLRMLPRYSLFPGQVVALEVTNHSGERLLAHAIHADAALPLPAQLPLLTPADGAMHLVIAAGPFTQMDTLGYQPLEDLVSYIHLHRPHVLVLIGPFIDCNHTLITDGSLAQTFQSFFDKILDGILEPLAKCGTQVVVVPSPRDAHHHAVYPCPPYTLRGQYTGVHLVSDPCMLDVQGLVVAATSVDTLLHLGKEEISLPAQDGDRLGRLASHVLAQQSLYPLYPPEESLTMDLDLWDQHARIPVTPHLLLLPSDLRFFIKELCGCVVVNPERLAKGIVGGSFARLAVSVIEGRVNVTGEVIKI